MGSNPGASDGVGLICVCMCVCVCAVVFYTMIECNALTHTHTSRDQTNQMPLSNPLQSTIIPYPGMTHSLAATSTRVCFTGACSRPSVFSHAPASCVPLLLHPLSISSSSLPAYVFSDNGGAQKLTVTLQASWTLAKLRARERRHDSWAKLIQSSL